MRLPSVVPVLAAATATTVEHCGPTSKEIGQAVLIALPFVVVAAVAIQLPLLVATRRRFPLTPLLYWLIAIHCLVLMLGGHYTYAREPFFSWLQQVFDLSRNHYDKLGHFIQGFVPALIARELFVRLKVVRGKWWLHFIVGSVCLAISALYELLEYAGAVILGDKATDFLGTQGYVWDTQTDMLMCLIGAVAALVLLSRWHDRQMKKYTQ